MKSMLLNDVAVVSLGVREVELHHSAVSVTSDRGHVTVCNWVECGLRKISVLGRYSIKIHIVDPNLGDYL